MRISKVTDYAALSKCYLISSLPGNALSREACKQTKSLRSTLQLLDLTRYILCTFVGFHALHRLLIFFQNHLFRKKNYSRNAIRVQTAGSRSSSKRLVKVISKRH